MKILATIVAVLVIVSAVFFGGLVFDAYFIAPGPEAQEKILIVESGDSVSQIADALVDGGVIKSAWPFKVFVKMTGASGQLQAGSFQLKTGMSYAAIVEALTNGRADEVTVTIPEGYTLVQIGEAVRAQLPGITTEAWTAAATPDLEGYLFPDTYRFFADATAQDVVSKMRAAFDERVGEISREDLTLASIVEREVRTPEEMKTVAGIFFNRLAIGMALQADSTVNYITGGDDPSVSYEDLQIDSPYNTYKYPGLPPGPISNPGLNAINAVREPADTPYYYFLTSPEGTVYYARTFEEHQQNRVRYLD